jgi:hypothetical protein
VSWGEGGAVAGLYRSNKSKKLRNRDAMKKFSQANHLVGIHAQLETRKPTGLLHECKDLSTVKSTQYYKLKRAIRQFKLPQ